MDRKRLQLMMLYIIIGAILGTILGIGLGKVFPMLNSAISFGFSPFALNLVIMNITFGITFYLNIGTVVGVILFLYLFLII